ncbi:3-phosphoglycerate dehydrogenase [Croceivirga lutea]|uniref:D-2-hydroxyacid dehydrogenase n=1 Tax=Croceivirga lutea TaxID=1775167 RepID=UPI00163B1B57|nr:D-2-hydroxyacid dehydrogenase [Croceivirga lutea]GGG44376.1 3-phosphoglycerate dehydrogenase [Croceivirga lutea]
MKILVNDGIAKAGKDILEAAGNTVIETKVAQEQLANYIAKNQIQALLVRSATKVDKKIIDKCPTLQLIGRGGVGLDNIDVAYAKSKGIRVINTPKASSNAVAELVFAHMLTGARHLQDANRNMPLEGDSNFKKLKKSYASATELKDKTLGIIGFGQIGRTVAKIAIGLGMKVLVHNKTNNTYSLELDFYDGQTITFTIIAMAFEEVLEKSDFISIHIPKQKNPIFTSKEFELMKDGVGIINTSRGENINEDDLLEAIESGKVSFAGLDVFVNEPNPQIKVLMNPSISLTPHIGGSTQESQERIGIELANQIVEKG